MPEKKKDPLDALPKGTFDMEVTYNAIFYWSSHLFYWSSHLFYDQVS